MPVERITRTFGAYEVTLIDRAPTSGERGWWVDSEQSLESCFAKVIDDSPPGCWGWAVLEREPDRYDADDDRSITIVIKEVDHAAHARR